MKFIKENDIWGIRQAVYQLWKNRHKYNPNKPDQDDKLLFNAFFNQYIPTPFKQSKETIIRHKDQILELMNNANNIWVRQEVFDRRGEGRGRSLKCIAINQSTLSRLRNTKEELPTYEEIETERMKWQSRSTYNKEQGFSRPILEEFVQLKFRGKKGGETN